MDPLFYQTPRPEVASRKGKTGDNLRVAQTKMEAKHGGANNLPTRTGKAGLQLLTP